MSREISESIYLFSYSNEPNYRQRCNFKLKDKNHATVYLYWFFKGTDNVLIVRLYSFNWSNCITFEEILILRLKISLLLTFQNLEVTNYVYRWLSICWFLYLYQLSRAQHHAHQLSSIYKWLSKQQRWAVNDAKLKVADIACIELHMFVDFKTNC